MNTEGLYTTIACPDPKGQGTLNVHMINEDSVSIINAHHSMLICIQLNPSGTKVATASNKGTCSRIFSTTDGTMLQELRRGSEYALIYNISFDPSGLFVASASDTG